MTKSEQYNIDESLIESFKKGYREGWMDAIKKVKEFLNQQETKANE